MNVKVEGAKIWQDWKVPAGTKIVDPPTLQDILAEDKEPIPVLLRHPGDLDPAPRLIPYDRYIDPKFIDAEIEHIWKKQWQVACREEDIPNIGDRINYDIVDQSYLIVHTAENEFKAFYNSCRHRGRKLCEAKGHGTGIRCPFHAWEYGLDGKLAWVPFEQEFPHVDAKHNSLVPVQAGSWGGNVFINPDPQAPPLEQALGPLVEHYKGYPIGERYTASRLVMEVACNWKAAQEAFMEGYHVVQTHADGMPMFGSVATQIDIWSEGLGYVSRLLTPGVMSDAWIEGQVTPREAVVMYCAAYGLPAPPEGRGHDRADARKYAAEMKRAHQEETTGKDWSQEPTTYFIDMGKYFMFPNFHPWWGEGTPRWFNFKPLGRNPDACEMEVRTLLPLPASGERPPMPEPYHLKLGELLEERFPQLGAQAHVLDQDLINMRAVQLGFKAAAPGTAYVTLSSYQEAKIRRFHEIYDAVLGLEPGH